MFDNFNYTANSNEVSLTIQTEYFTLTYAKEKPISNNNIKVLVNGTDKEWYPGNKEVRNIGGMAYSLDDIEKNKNLNLDKGLYSLDGYVLIDDSKNFIIEMICF